MKAEQLTAKKLVDKLDNATITLSAEHKKPKERLDKELSRLRDKLKEPATKLLIRLVI